MRLFNVILMCSVMAWTGCQNPKVYERYVEPSYNDKGQVRPGYVTINRAYMDALYADLVACYGQKKP